MKTPYFWAKPGAQDLLIDHIKRGGVVLADSDTVAGLFAAVTQKGATALDDIKTRKDKPYLIIIGEKSDWMRFADAPSDIPALWLMDACWPGPLTVILPMRVDMPDYVGSAQKTVALRMPDHAGLCAVARACGGIFSTSANKTGEPVPEMLSQVDEEIQDAVGAIVSDEKGEGEQHGYLPSTILDCTGDQVRVVREGAYGVEELERIYKERRGVGFLR